MELPVGATEDRLTGSLDVGRALTEGVTSFQPGLLAAAHRGVLYVDEVNLLHDHLVDLLLDAAALGTSYVERDGVSVRHAARFLLVGTMNPEEGELRPQLLDRFGLTVEAVAPRDPATRAEVVRRRMGFDADPAAFTARFAADEAELAASIAAAQARLPAVVLRDEELERIAGVCAAFDVDGLRADIVIARTAAAHAAWHGRRAVNREDIRVAALLALPHRRRRNPFDAPGLDEKQLDEALGDDLGPDDEPDPQPPGQGPEDDGDGGAPPDGPRPACRRPARRQPGTGRQPARRRRRRPPTTPRPLGTRLPGIRSRPRSAGRDANRSWPAARLSARGGSRCRARDAARRAGARAPTPTRVPPSASASAACRSGTCT